jgi:hypothetical protein
VVKNVRWLHAAILPEMRVTLTDKTVCRAVTAVKLAMTAQSMDTPPICFNRHATIHVGGQLPLPG